MEYLMSAVCWLWTTIGCLSGAGLWAWSAMYDRIGLLEDKVAVLTAQIDELKNELKKRG